MGALAGWIGGPHASDEACAEAPDEAALLPALEALAHRGATGEGIVAFQTDGGQRVTLGQPYYDAAAGIAVALDGGHAFEGSSPAAALVRAYRRWDQQVVHHLRGAFAFALWDAGRERLMLARDRLGEKPLYLTGERTLFFASEVKALLRMPGVRAEAEPAAVRAYLAHRYVPGPRTLVRGIRKLAPGSYALSQFGRVREVRYWSPPDAKPLTAKVEGDAVARFTELLEDAVKLHLPAGLFLSGGFDSAMLAALACRHARIKTYSAGFAGDRASELARAKALAQHFGTEHHEITLCASDVIARLAQAIRHRDAPLSRPSDLALYALACEAARSSHAVMTGEGADEVLGGYRRHVLPTLLFWQRPEDNAPPGVSALRRALYAEQASWLPDNVLERADRLTMAASLEARAPFLDHRLVEFVAMLPDAQRVRGLSTKWILRRAARPLLRELKPRKGGFVIPAGAWMRGELRDFLIDHLRAGASLARAYYDPQALDRVLDEHLAGKRNHETLLWTLLNLEIWHRNCLRP